MKKQENNRKSVENRAVLAPVSPDCSGSDGKWLIRPNSEARDRYQSLRRNAPDSRQFRKLQKEAESWKTYEERKCQKVAFSAAVERNGSDLSLVPEIANRNGWELTEAGFEAVSDYFSVFASDREQKEHSEEFSDIYSFMNRYKNNFKQLFLTTNDSEQLFDPITTSEVVTGKIVSVNPVSDLLDKFNKEGLVSISVNTDRKWFDLSETDFSLVVQDIEPDYVVVELSSDFYNYNYLYINNNSYCIFKIHFKGAKTAYLAVVEEMERISWLTMETTPSFNRIKDIVGEGASIGKFERIWDAFCIANYVKDKSLKNKARMVFNDQYVIDEAFSRPFGLMRTWIEKRWNYNRFTTKFGWKATEFDSLELQALSDEMFEEGGSIDYQLTSRKDWNKIFAQFRAKFEELELEELERDQFEDKLDSEWAKLSNFIWNDNFQNEEVLTEAFKPSKAWRSSRKASERANRSKVFTIPCEGKTRTAHEVMMDIGSVKLPISNSKPYSESILPKQEGESLNRFEWKEMPLYKKIRDCRVFKPYNTPSRIPIWETIEGEGFVMYCKSFKPIKNNKDNKENTGKKARKPLPFGNRVAKRTILTKAIWGAFEFDVLDEIIEFQVYKEVVKELRGE